ncbi:hypothetical protein NBO_38g0004 [Nosema bombycis CQ1]|uniref:Uncharacterized protein n=1 Tax=Nosema bombycis (strain CQ1 / CVCC 102059) TaxID=578461 RepID=R0MMK2_NOSB1|nr:hypothetical protein NBO_38g0004 [Nosema bombycis CQ1]|eukprot:EOB14093.1 hypothetical protein NBO_38g0004 [Nosema bombycis CQ1]
MIEGEGHSDLFTRLDVQNETNKQKFDQVSEMIEDNSKWLSIDNFSHNEIDKQAVDCILDMSDRPYFSEFNKQKNVETGDLSLQEHTPLPEEVSEPGSSTQKVSLQSEISNHVVNIDSLIDTLRSEDDHPAENFSSNNQDIPLSPSNSVETSSQFISFERKEVMYLQINVHIRTLINDSYVDSYLERLNGVKAMLDHITQPNLQNLEITRSFMNSLDKLILQLLDSLNLRKANNIEFYEMQGYETFNFYISDQIYNMKIYDYICQNISKCEKEFDQIFNDQFLQLYNYFPDFPELMTLGSLIKKGLDEKLLLFIRIIQMIIKENKTRLLKIKPVILFIIKKLFLMPHNRTQYIDLALKEKFNFTKAYIKRYPCYKNHSNLRSYCGN